MAVTGRYTVEAYEPGRRVRFRFTAPAERSLTGPVESPACWSPCVRLLRKILARTKRARKR